MKTLIAISAALLLSLSAASAAVSDCTQWPHCSGNVVVDAPVVLGGTTGTQANAEIVLDVDEPLPESISLPRNGGTITVTRKTRPNTADVAVEVNAIDGVKDPLVVANSTLPTPPAGSVVLYQFKANRAGRGDITITHTVKRPGAEPYNETLRLIIR